MFEWEEKLAARYAFLRESRAGPVFFIEHGLATGERADLIADVRAAVETYPLHSDWWNTRKLPLIVSSTEAGYRYSGSGTDFWPTLEAELGTEFGSASRQRVRDLFVSAAEFYRGARPPRTPWAKAFHLIAWPITHALVPREFHRPLALTLANLRASVADLSDEALYRAIRVAASTSSARFDTLIDSPDLIIPVTKSLLGTNTEELCPETMQRIADELSCDQLARRSIAVARRLQRSTRATVLPTPTGTEMPSIKGVLQIRRRDGTLTLEASFPPLESNVSRRLRKALRRKRYAPRLWGVTARVPSDQFLSGLPFALKLEAAPADDAPLLPGLDELYIDAEVLGILRAFELLLEPPLVFAVSADGEVARMVRGGEISGYRRYWVLATEHASIVGPSPSLGKLGPYSCHEFDPQIPSEARALEDLGYRVRFGVSVSLAGVPPLCQGDSVTSFEAGDRILVVPRRSHPDGLHVEFGGESAHVTDALVRLMVPSGDGLVHASSGGKARELRIRGVSNPPTLSLTACSIEFRSSELTLQALLGGTLSFVIDSPAPIEGLDATIVLEAGDRRCSATFRLGALPHTVSAAQEPFETLLDDATRAFLLQVAAVTLHVRVGCLTARSLQLERRVRPCWWAREDDHVVLKTELSDLDYGQVAAASPHLMPTQTEPAPESEARLLVPVGFDAVEFGPATQFTTLCLAPRQASLAAPLVPKPRLKRCRHAENDAAGLEDLLGAYLRWSLAESENLIAELRRRQIVEKLDLWVAELCCGEEWARREARASPLGPWESLIAYCDENRLGLDSYVQLSRDDEDNIIRSAVSNIRTAIPELWSRLGPPSELGTEDYALLDDACIKAYEDLSDEYRNRGRLELSNMIGSGDPSADTSPERWELALRHVQAQVELHELAELLLPTDKARELLVLDTSAMSLDELSDELTRWVSDARRSLYGGTPEAGTLRATLALWTEPEAAVNLDWWSTTDVLLVERPVARATRYLALKSRRARSGGHR